MSMRILLSYEEKQTTNQKENFLLTNKGILIYNSRALQDGDIINIDVTV